MNKSMKHSPKIAIIDDDPDILEALNLVFEIEGYQTKTTLKGEETRQIVREFKPDIILLDVLLSGKDGRVICKDLKQDLQTKAIPVIMMSAHPEAKKTVMEVGADDFIAKPFDVSKLFSLISGHIN
jgi:DNA-binding response OmpR family regulator